MSYDLGQTFFFDKQALQDADVGFVTSVELYFAAKPIQDKSATGIGSPGVTVAIGLTKEDGSPDLSTLTNLEYTARMEYGDIQDDTTGNTSTKFTFRQPVPLNTNRSYAFLVKFDGGDQGFQLFCNKAGRNAINTSAATQVSSGVVDGNAYKVTNGYNLTPLTDTDLSFKLNIAKFNVLDRTYQIRNRPYESLKIGNVVGDFIGGEEVYQQRSSLTGTLSVSSTSTTVTGTGTSFDVSVLPSDKIVISDGTSGNTVIRTIESVTNSTQIILSAPPTFSNSSATYYKTVTGELFYVDLLNDEMYIQNSTANSTVYLSSNTRIVGLDSGATANVVLLMDFEVNAVRPNYNITSPSGTKARIAINFANTGGSITSTNKRTAALGRRSVISQYDAIVASRTNEVTSGTPFVSFQGDVTFTSTNPYTSPYVREEDLDLFAERYSINNSTNNEYKGQGDATARHITKQVTLAENQLAEDLKVYLTAFRPLNTDIVVYGKFLNPEDIESFNMKDWTELTLDQSTNLTTSQVNLNDRIELTYSVPFYHTGTQLSGVFTTTTACNEISGTSGSVSSEVSVGDVVRVYSPTFANSYFVDTVTSANATHIVVSKAVSNASVVGVGFYVDKISRPNSGYLDIQQGNVLTYYNTSLSKFRGYKTFAIKIVLLSSDGINTPFVDDIRALAVSA